MNRGTLPIVARLRSLQTPARFAPGGARVIAEASARDQLAQLLRATNETVLNRSLQFDSASGPSLTLDVSGRRVLRLTAAIGLPDAESCLSAEVLEDEHKDDLIKLLQAVAVPQHELRVTSGPIGRGAEQVSVGLPVALLADLVLIDLNDLASDETQPLEPEQPVETAVADTGRADTSLVVGTGAGLASFAETLGPELVAWLIAGGDDDGKTAGAEEMVSHLQGFLDDEGKAVDGQLDLLSSEPGGPICVMLGVSLVEGHSIVCARMHASVLLGIIEGDGTGAALAAWRTTLG